MKITSLLGLASLTAAAALLGAACAGRTTEGGHAGAHPPSPSAQPAAPPSAAPQSGAPQTGAGQNGAGQTDPGQSAAAQAGASRDAARAAPSGAATPSSSAAGDPAHTVNPVAAKCRATVALVETWPGGYRGTATISNRGDRPLSGWYIQWMMPREATITQAWKGTHMQSGPVAMIHAPAQDPPLAPGKTISEIGFIGVAATPPAFTEITCG